MNQPLSQQAALQCKSELFRRWAAARMGVAFESLTQSAVDAWLRAEIGVASRSELDRDPAAAERFEALRSEFRRTLAEAV